MPRVAALLHGIELVGDGRHHAEGEGAVHEVALLVIEAEVRAARLVAPEFGADGRVDDLRQIPRRRDVHRHAIEDEADRSRGILLAPDHAVAEMRDRGHAGVERDALVAARLEDEPLARVGPHLDVAHRQRMAVEQFRHFRGGRQRLLFGAAVEDGLRPQGRDAVHQLFAFRRHRFPTDPPRALDRQAWSMATAECHFDSRHAPTRLPVIAK